jgi:hypothetical protein
MPPSRLPSRLFYSVMAVYIVYNALWLLGTTFSFGRNDTRRELLYLCLTFGADIPVFFGFMRTPRIGSVALGFLFLSGMGIGASLGILNSVTLLLWYLPKVIPLAAAIWLTFSKSARTESEA